VKDNAEATATPKVKASQHHASSKREGCRQNSAEKMVLTKGNSSSRQQRRQKKPYVKDATTVISYKQQLQVKTRAAVPAKGEREPQSAATGKRPEYQSKCVSTGFTVTVFSALPS
jgi:hypothetical protein